MTPLDELRRYVSTGGRYSRTWGVSFDDAQRLLEQLEATRLERDGLVAAARYVLRHLDAGSPYDRVVVARELRAAIPGSILDEQPEADARMDNLDAMGLTPPEGLTPAEFDLWWTGEKPDPDCPSCFGTGWATVRSGGVTFAGGRCKCRPSRTVWAASNQEGERPC